MLGFSAARGVCLALALLAAGCAQRQGGEIEHAVFVWLNRPGNAEDCAALVGTAEGLRKETGLFDSLRTGGPVPSERPVVDDSFDVAMIMRFANREKLEAFENHPAHRKARKEVLTPLARKVLVYDVAVE